MDQIIFASKNENKFQETRTFLIQYKIQLDLFHLDLPEIQSDFLEKIASNKASFAYKIIKEKLIVEDTGLFIHALNNFPGPYSSFALRTIGNSGILDLLSSKHNRSATFKSVIAFNDGKSIHLFSGAVEGTISPHVASKGWGFDPIFIPSGHKRTYGEIGPDKIEISHRTIALKKFIRWYKGFSPSQNRV